MSIKNYDDFKQKFEEYYETKLVKINIKELKQFVKDNKKDMFTFIIKQLIHIIYYTTEEFDLDFYLNNLIVFNKITGQDDGLYKSEDLTNLIKFIILNDKTPAPGFLDIIVTLTGYNTPSVRTTIVDKYILNKDNFIYAYDNEAYIIFNYLIHLYYISDTELIDFNELLNKVIHKKDTIRFKLLLEKGIESLNNEQIKLFFNLTNANKITDETISTIINLNPILKTINLDPILTLTNEKKINVSERISQLIIRKFIKSDKKDQDEIDDILKKYIDNEFIKDIIDKKEIQYNKYKDYRRYRKYKQKYINLQKKNKYYI
jgi:hypothetical protein